MKLLKTVTAVAALTLIASGAIASDGDALKEQTALLLNLNGLLCAKVLDIKPLKVRQNVYEITCIEYRGGTGTKTYIMDAAKGTAWAQ